jgi:hypothetical protein
VCGSSTIFELQNLFPFSAPPVENPFTNIAGQREIRTSLFLLFANGLQFSWRNPLANTGDPGGALTCSHGHTNA